MASKVLFVHSSDDLYGADLILLNLVRGLDKERFAPIVALPTDVVRDGALTRALREARIPTVGLKLAVLRRQFFSPWGIALFAWRLIASTIALARLIRRESVALVHSHTSAVLPGALGAWMTGRPHVWQTLEIIVAPRFLWRAIAWLMPRLSERVVAASGPTREHLCAGDRRNEAKASVFRYGLDPSRIDAGRGEGRAVRAEWRIDEDAPVVGVVGRVSEWKGQAYFLRVAALVARRHPEARFVVVGGTFDGRARIVEDLKVLARDLGIAEAVRFDGYRTDVPAVLDAMDIFVLPSTLPDPFPTAVLEAMAAGKPVVANAQGGSVEMVVHEATGLLVPPDRAEAMAEAVTRLIERPEERRRFGEEGRTRLVSRFTLDSYVRCYADLYSSLLAAAKAS